MIRVPIGVEQKQNSFVCGYQGITDYRDPTGRMCGGHPFSYRHHQSRAGHWNERPDLRLVGCLTCAGHAVDAATLETFEGAGIAEYRETGTTRQVKTSRGDIEVKDREWVIVRAPQQVLTVNGLVCAALHRQRIELGCESEEVAGPVLYPVRAGE